MITSDEMTQWLEIPESVHTAASQQGQVIPGLGDRWQAYLNQICSDTMRQWFQEKYPHEITLASPIPDGSGRPELWAMVSGSAINLGNLRLIIIPIEAMDKQEFRVSQEWLDLPNWIGDYYLAIEVDADEQWINLWGYTTHQTLKSQGNYDSSDRTYSIPGDALVQDMKVLWVMHQLAAEPTRAAVPALQSLTNAQIDRLIHQLENTILPPRLAVPFAEWGALMESEVGRDRLYESRYPNQSLSTSISVTAEQATVNLSRWFQNVVEVGWQSVEDFLQGSSTPALAFSFRREETAIDSARYLKSFQLGETTILLFVMLTLESDRRLSVRVRALPETDILHLPSQLELALLSPTEGVLQSIQAREQDNSIQLSRFRCSPGMQFQIQITLGEHRISETFIG